MRKIFKAREGDASLARLMATHQTTEFAVSYDSILVSNPVMRRFRQS
jgi:hypothetical protein